MMEMRTTGREKLLLSPDRMPLAMKSSKFKFLIFSAKVIQFGDGGSAGTGGVIIFVCSKEARPTNGLQQ
jgi:hypothetical protein